MLLNLQINANNIAAATGIATFQIANDLKIDRMVLRHTQIGVNNTNISQFDGGSEVAPNIYCEWITGLDTNSIMCYGNTTAKAVKNSFPLGRVPLLETRDYYNPDLLIVDEPTTLSADFTIRIFELNTTTSTTAKTINNLSKVFSHENLGSLVYTDSFINLCFEIDLTSHNRMNLND